MPELPEVEHLRRTLTKGLMDRTVTRVRVLRSDVVTTPSPTRRRNALLAGARITALLRHGKQLAIVADDGRAVCVHLGMSGRLTLGDKNPPRRHDHVHWQLSDGKRLVFHDPRRFGGIWTFPSLGDLQNQRWNDLGPDALGVTAQALRCAIQKRNRPVKAALLDQHLLAGVGNIYADEALFAAGVHPERSCRSLTAAEIQCLATTVRRVLRAALRQGGSTIASYVDANGSAGRFQTRHLVYGRAGAACLRCGRTLESSTVAQRTTIACSHCQPRR